MKFNLIKRFKEYRRTMRALNTKIFILEETTKITPENTEARELLKIHIKGTQAIENLEYIMEKVDKKTR